MKVKGWRYGIVKHITPNGEYHAVHEIHRDGDKISWTENPISIVTDEAREIHEEILMISRDISIHEIIVVDENNNLLPDHEVNSASKSL